MRNYLCILLIIFSSKTQYSQSTIVKVAPLVSVRLEQKISKKFSIQVGSSFTLIDFLGKTTYKSLSGGIRIYTKESLKGYYFYPIFTKTTVTNCPGTLIFSSNKTNVDKYFSYGIIFGHQSISSKGFTTDTGFGIAYGEMTSSTYKDPTPNRFLYKFHPKITLGIGYAF